MAGRRRGVHEAAAAIRKTRARRRDRAVEPSRPPEKEHGVDRQPSLVSRIAETRSRICASMYW